MDNKLDMLAIAAHPDDIEITCGGLLIKMSQKDYQTGALDLTKGEMGSHGDEQDRLAEADKAAEIMGLSYRNNLGIPDAAVEYNQSNKLKIAQEIRNTRPKIVILPHHAQRHPDHHACHHLGYDACFLAGLKKINLEGEPYRPKKIIYVSYFRNNDYSFLVDISNELKLKMKAVASYKSQFGENIDFNKIIGSGFDNKISDTGNKDIFHPGTSVFDFMYTKARYLGQMVNVKFAEAYTIKEQILIDDPLEMPVRSL